jgi:hypothetical protein
MIRMRLYHTLRSCAISLFIGGALTRHGARIVLDPQRLDWLKNTASWDNSRSAKPDSGSPFYFSRLPSCSLRRSKPLSATIRSFPPAAGRV